MKELWLEINANDDKKESLQALAVQYGDVIIEDNKATIVANKEILNVISPLGKDALEKLKIEKKILRICISNKETENQTVRAAELGASYLIISCENWRVIPLENLIARIRGKSKLIAEVANAEEAKIALETLELGTDGVLLKTTDIDEIMKTVAIVKPETLKTQLSIAKIIESITKT